MGGRHLCLPKENVMRAPEEKLSWDAPKLSRISAKSARNGTNASGEGNDSVCGGGTRVVNCSSFI